jgi:CRP-like cAMP-binding protein
MENNFKEVTLEEGQILFKKGQSCKYCYIVRNGHVACFSLSSDKRVVPVFSVKDFGLVGEDSLFNSKEVHDYNAIVLSKTVLVKIPKKDVMLYLNEAGDWMKNILFDLAEKLSNTAEVVVEHKIVDERLNEGELFSDEEQKILLKAIS